MTSMFFIQGAKIVNDNISYPCFSIFYLCNCDPNTDLTSLHRNLLDKPFCKGNFCRR